MDNNARRKLVWSSLNYTIELMMDLFIEDGDWTDDKVKEAQRQLLEIRNDIAPQVID